MLTALEQGVKGGKWYSLMDKVCSLQNLQSAFDRVKANKGNASADHHISEMCEKHLEENLAYLSTTLQDGTYQTQAIKRVWIPKRGSSEKRPLGIPTVRGRVVQAALCNALEPIFERDFAEHSFGFRPGRGCKDALHRVDALLKAGSTWVVDGDLKSYFDTIPRQPLLDLVRAKISDNRVLALLQAYLEQRVMDTAKDWTPEQGTQQCSSKSIRLLPTAAAVIPGPSLSARLARASHIAER